MELVTGAMGSLLPKLGELLKEEYNLQKGVRKKVQSLLRELETMHAALRKVAEVPREQLDELIKLWARDVRELSYDMEDVIDTYRVRVEDGREATKNPHRLKKLMKKMSNLFSKGKARHQIAKAIQDINKQLQEVANRHVRYTVDSIVVNHAATSTIDPRLLAMYKDAVQLVGIDGPKDTLINMLSEGEDASNKKMKIVSVVGFGGLGKTTLAKAVYDKLKVGFDCYAFVPVGQNPDMKKVFRDILIDLDKEKYRNSNMIILDERQLINELREFLENKRYFIIIDDIWNKESWETIKCALADCNCGSRVVATTRISEVATNVGDVYKLQPLSRDNSEKLFNIRIVDREGKRPHDQSTEVYDAILNKCGGVPLAIITIASLLASKQEEDWPKVYNSIGFGHEDNDVVKNTRKILSFSYYDLPSHLKTCLLYLSVFPEGYYIEKNLLTWKWIAEGFVHDEHGIGLLDIAEEYFNELINRSMIMPSEVRETGFVIGCRVHDMVLDIICPLSSEENFVTIPDNEQQTIQHRNARRLALQKRFKEHNPLANMGVQHVRSFTAIFCGIGIISPSFQVLRVLAIEYCRFMEGYNSLKHLGNLLHLRYLGLTFTPVRELPKEIGDLKFLQTLELCGTGIEELPSSVGLLTELVCLHADEKTRVPDWIGNLTSLQQLWIGPAVDSSARFVKDLGNLRELRALKTMIDVQDESLERALVESLHNLHKIQIVDMGGKALGKGATWGTGFVSPGRLRFLNIQCLEFSRLPVWINSSHLPNLCFLDVRVQVMQEQDMETLGRLPQLRSLRLFSRYTPAISIICGDGQLFHKLRFFTTNISIRFVHGECSMEIPSLEALEFDVDVEFLKDANLGFDKFGLGILPLIQKVTARIDCRDACAAEVEEAEAALRHIAAVHPNRPTLQTTRLHEDQMLSSGQEAIRFSRKVAYFDVNVRKQKDEEHYFNFCWLLQRPRVEKFSVCINCEDASVGEVGEAEAALRHAVDIHPNHPTLEIIMLPASYYDLPAHLRTCLLYLSVFPKDYPIDKNLLIWKWIAEGFVHDEQGIGLLEVGEIYFNELINRSMINPSELADTGYVTCCRIHAMVLDLVRSLSSKENFVTILDNKQKTFSQSNAPRLALQNIIEEHNPLANMGVQHVSSVTAIHCRVGMISPSFQVLRTLAIENCGFMEGYNNLEHLGNLLHLRYLGLSYTPVCGLPKEIGGLKFLQTLELTGTGIEELPQSVGLLTQLVCLRADEKTRVPDWIGNLTSLQELWILHAADRSARFVKGLGNLRELRVLKTMIDVQDESLERALVESLGNLHKIQFVDMGGKALGKGATWETGFVFPRLIRYLSLGCLEFSRLPTWINSSLLPNLCFLAMEVQVVQEQDMETLGRLPQLHALRLFSGYTSAIGIICRDGQLFHKLRFFTTNTSIRFVHGERSMAPIMPSLEALDFHVHVRFLKDANLGFDKFGLENLLSLHRITASIDCRYVHATEVEEAEAALRHAAAVHPNRPTLQTTRLCEDQMLSSGQEATRFSGKVVDWVVHVREEKDEEHYFNFCWLLGYPCIEKFRVSIICEDASIGEVEEAEAALRHAVDVHPNHPALEIMRDGEDKMMLSDRHQQQQATRWSRKVVDLDVNVREEKDEKHYFNFCWLLGNPCVDKVSVCMNCEDASVGEVEEAEAALRHAVDIHPNHPTLEIMMLPASYYDLPSHLRTCLLYLSVFPEDYMVEKNLLIWKWIAEGFVHDEQGIGLFEIGERYFNELIDRRMIKPVEFPDTGYVRGCYVPDVVFDLIRSLSSEENFVTILDNEQQTFSHSNARRLAFHRIKEHNPLANMGVQHVRSFTAILCDIGMISPSFRVLRVLAIENSNFMEGYNSLEHLGNLLHLRYLGLTGTPIRELPKEIGDLKFLQTMVLWGTGIEELPSSVGLLTQLVCLRADEKTRVPDWIGNLTSLQELWIWPAVDSSARFVKELGNLRELRELETNIDVWEESLERDLVESLSNLHKIQSLAILGKPFGKGATWEAGTVSPRLLRFLSLGCLDFSRLPVWINSSLLLNICFLDMKVHVVQEQDMETLGRLPQLRGLVLWSMYTPVVSIIDGDGQLFCKLRFFTMGNTSIRFVHGECSMAPIMSSLEALEFNVRVRFMKDANLSFDKLGLENLPLLQKVTARIDCHYGRAAEVEEAEAALRHAAAVHPNRPTLETTRLHEDRMLSSDQDQEPTRCSGKVVDWVVDVRKEKDEEHYFDFRWLLLNPRVEKVNVCINCEDASVGEVEEAEAALRHAVDIHPNHPTLETMMLPASYYDLPAHLRTCLLYLSVFPKDYWIDKNLLIWKWIAEDFVHDEQGIGLLEVGEIYFNELINRSMIKLYEEPNTGYVRGCHVHDMVLDLVRSLSSEENFVTILGNEQQTFSHSNARRLAFHRIKEHNPLANMGVQHVRSFIAIWCDIGMTTPSFRVLRILAIEYCGFMEGYNSLEHLGNLLHLRYLGLTYTPVRGLPKEIGGLKFLQTLELSGTGIEELPQSVGLLTQLVCLHADEKTRVLDWIGNLTSLQELWIRRAAERPTRFVKELGNLRELRVLVARIDVRDESLERALVESLGNLHKIQNVDMGGKALGKGATWETGFVFPRLLRFLNIGCLEFSRLPTWINSSLLPNLWFLHVRVQVVQEQDMETLGRLPQLRSLHLHSRYTAVVSIIGGDGQLFHKLRFFTTDIYIRFVHGEGSMAPIMPSLEALDFPVIVQFLKDANLGFDKLGLENLPSIQRVTARIRCQYARAAEVEEAEAALRHAVDVHRSHPALEITRDGEDKMMLSDRHQQQQEELGTEYLVQPLDRAEDEEHSSDFEPDENSDGAEDEEIEEDEVLMRLRIQ